MTAPVPSDPSLVETPVTASAGAVGDASEARADTGGVGATAARVVPTPLDVEVSRELERLAHDRHLEVPSPSRVLRLRYGRDRLGRYERR